MKKQNKNDTLTHARAFAGLAKKMDDLSKKSTHMRELFLAMGPGHYEDVTVYRVAEHKVSAYTRRGYVAVRVNIRKPRYIGD